MTCAGFFGENRHGERTGDAGFPGIGLGDSAEVLLEIAEFHRFPALGGGSGDAFAEGDR